MYAPQGMPRLSHLRLCCQRHPFQQESHYTPKHCSSQLATYLARHALHKDAPRLASELLHSAAEDSQQQGMLQQQTILQRPGQRRFDPLCDVCAPHACNCLPTSHTYKCSRLNLPRLHKAPSRAQLIQQRGLPNASPSPCLVAWVDAFRQDRCSSDDLHPCHSS